MLRMRGSPARAARAVFTSSASISTTAAAIAERKCNNVLASGAKAVVGGDLGCLLNIEGKLRRMGNETTQVLHVAEVLAGRI